MPLTDARIRGLKPGERPYKTADFDGLYILTKPTGSRLWRFKYRIGGKEKVFAIGSYPEVSLTVARKVRDEARADLAAGVDPNELKQESKRLQRAATEHSFSRLADAFLEKSRKEGRAKSTLAKAEWLLDMAKAEFGDKPIADITAQMVLVCLRKVEVKGNHETARRLRSKVGAVFRYAVASGLAENDPTAALKDALVRPKVTSRAAITDPIGFGELLRRIDTYSGEATTRIALKLLALVAQRPGELRQAKWEEIDRVSAIWTIPADRMKMRRPHRVPLPRAALDLLDELSLLSGQSEYLLPAIGKPRKPMSENTLNAALKRLEYGGKMTAHGFRATFSTLANESGLWNPDAIERALAHEDGNAVRKAYARGEHWEERIRLAEWWSMSLEDFRRSF